MTISILTEAREPRGKARDQRKGVDGKDIFSVPVNLLEHEPCFVVFLVGSYFGCVSLLIVFCICIDSHLYHFYL